MILFLEMSKPWRVVTDDNHDGSDPEMWLLLRTRSTTETLAGRSLAVALGARLVSRLLDKSTKSTPVRDSGNRPVKKLFLA